MNNKPNRGIEILIGEDNPGDVFIINNVLSCCAVEYNLHHVEDGEAAMDYLRQTGKYKEAPRPNLILLDLNLPKKHGFEVLKEIKDDPELRSIPVIVLTSSQSEKDIAQSYNLYASCYLIKPFDFNEFELAVEMLKNFWLKIVALPPQPSSAI